MSEHRIDGRQAPQPSLSSIPPTRLMALTGLFIGGAYGLNRLSSSLSGYSRLQTAIPSALTIAGTFALGKNWLIPLPSVPVRTKPPVIPNHPKNPQSTRPRHVETPLPVETQATTLPRPSSLQGRSGRSQLRSTSQPTTFSDAANGQGTSASSTERPHQPTPTDPVLNTSPPLISTAAPNSSQLDPTPPQSPLSQTRAHNLPTSFSPPVFTAPTTPTGDVHNQTTVPSREQIAISPSSGGNWRATVSLESSGEQTYVLKTSIQSPQGNKTLERNLSACGFNPRVAWLQTDSGDVWMVTCIDGAKDGAYPVLSFFGLNPERTEIVQLRNDINRGKSITDFQLFEDTKGGPLLLIAMSKSLICCRLTCSEEDTTPSHSSFSKSIIGFVCDRRGYVLALQRNGHIAALAIAIGGTSHSPTLALEKREELKLPLINDDPPNRIQSCSKPNTYLVQTANGQQFEVSLNLVNNQLQLHLVTTPSVPAHQPLPIVTAANAQPLARNWRASVTLVPIGQSQSYTLGVHMQASTTPNDVELVISPAGKNPVYRMLQTGSGHVLILVFSFSQNQSYLDLYSTSPNSSSILYQTSEHLDVPLTAASLVKHPSMGAILLISSQTQLRCSLIKPTTPHPLTSDQMPPPSANRSTQEPKWSIQHAPGQHIVKTNQQIVGFTYIDQGYLLLMRKNGHMSAARIIKNADGESPCLSWDNEAQLDLGLVVGHRFKEFRRTATPNTRRVVLTNGREVDVAFSISDNHSVLTKRQAEQKHVLTQEQRQKLGTLIHELPHELFSMVFASLNPSDDRLVCRAVCKAWRSLIDDGDLAPTALRLCRFPLNFVDLSHSVFGLATTWQRTIGPGLSGYPFATLESHAHMQTDTDHHRQTPYGRVAFQEEVIKPTILPSCQPQPVDINGTTHLLIPKQDQEKIVGIQLINGLTNQPLALTDESGRRLDYLPVKHLPSAFATFSLDKQSFIAMATDTGNASAKIDFFTIKADHSFETKTIAIQTAVSALKIWQPGPGVHALIVGGSNDEGKPTLLVLDLATNTPTLPYTGREEGVVTVMEALPNQNMLLFCDSAGTLRGMSYDRSSHRTQRLWGTKTKKRASITLINDSHYLVAMDGPLPNKKNYSFWLKDLSQYTPKGTLPSSHYGFYFDQTTNPIAAVKATSISDRCTLLTTLLAERHLSKMNQENPLLRSPSYQLAHHLLYPIGDGYGVKLLKLESSDAKNAQNVQQACGNFFLVRNNHTVHSIAFFGAPKQGEDLWEIEARSLVS